MGEQTEIENEKWQDNYGWAFIDFFISLNEEINMVSVFFFFLLFANINREVEYFDHVQVNRYEQTDDILLGW
jgi:hypothetical protein